MRFLKLLLFIVLLSTSGQLFAGINIQGLEYNLDGSEKSAVAVGLSGDQTDIVVPASVIFNGNEYAVVRVKGDIFQNSKVTSVTFSEDFNGEIDDENSPFLKIAASSFPWFGLATLIQYHGVVSKTVRS